MRFYIETYGCTANWGNSRECEAALLNLGHLPSTLEDADAVIVNTCAVTERTQAKILRRLRQLHGERLVIGGCLSAALPESVQQIHAKRRLGMLNKAAAEEIAELFAYSISRDPAKAIHRSSSPSASRDLCGIVNIAEGCNGSCSYCIVRAARGRLVSRSPEEVVDAVHKLVASGMVEIQLAAQDTAAYGQDIGSSLPELMERVTQVPGRFKVRVGMMNPDTVRPIKWKLIRVLQDHKVYRFLHLPVQSGSDSVLEDMGRRYSRRDFMQIVNDFRAAIPDLHLITDAIVGFPTEKDSDFKQTRDFIEHLQPDKVNVTRFSRRPGTAAARLYDMPDRIKKDRSRELTRLWLEIAAARNRCYIGKVLDVRVTECGRGETMKARSANYRGIVIRGAPDLGSLCQTRITGSNPFYLDGILQL